MTDPSSQSPTDDPSRPVRSEAATGSEKASGPPPSPLPRGPRVFGQRAFLITAVPFLIYWGGTALGGYVEKTRKLAPAHTMHSVVRATLNQVRENLESMEPEKQAEWKERLNFDALKEILDNEEAKVEEIRRVGQQLLEGDFSDAALIVELQNYLQHFLELQTRVEQNDLDGIRELHETFLGKTVDDPSFSDERFDWFPEHRSWYPTTYTIACLAALIAVVLAFPGYLRAPFRISWLGVGVGVIGIVIWIGLWYLDKHFIGLGALISPHSRAGFNPLAELKDHPTWMYQFLAVRFIGLVLVIPIAEEFFTRGFLMRYIDDPDWDEIPLGAATWKAVVGVIVYGVLAHPGEALAAAAWFSLVTWLYLRTKSIWDCVVAHGVTNLLLGVYVLVFGVWELW